MTIHRCPQCRNHSLVRSGAFWACRACGLAVTGHALSVDCDEPWLMLKRQSKHSPRCIGNDS